MEKKSGAEKLAELERRRKQASKERTSSEFARAKTEDDDGYDPWSDRPPAKDPLFESDPWS